MERCFSEYLIQINKQEFIAKKQFFLLSLYTHDQFMVVLFFPCIQMKIILFFLKYLYGMENGIFHALVCFSCIEKFLFFRMEIFRLSRCCWMSGDFFKRRKLLHTALSPHFILKRRENCPKHNQINAYLEDEILKKNLNFLFKYGSSLFENKLFFKEVQPTMNSLSLFSHFCVLFPLNQCLMLSLIIFLILITVQSVFSSIFKDPLVIQQPKALKKPPQFCHTVLFPKIQKNRHNFGYIFSN